MLFGLLNSRLSGWLWKNSSNSMLILMEVMVLVMILVLMKYFSGLIFSRFIVSFSVSSSVL